MGSIRLNLALCGIAVLAPATASAQLDDRTVANVLRECRQIADTAARTACYDNIPLGPAATAAPAPGPGQAAVIPPRPSGFGSDQLPQARAVEAGKPDRHTAAVAGAVEREPGIYLLTLDDGAQWQFIDAAPLSYAPPRRGSTVEIIAASMGSYLLRHAGQRALRVRRVR